ncbi:YhcN/YlaJ family sporulation lipoprotein [Paenibacillus humicola]|uniref:YhcN/YlaJ family sporulation lipoprotein n=1 Tax=Paenibacillus humicola TaxID=3110540 RepID=UPI00237B1EFE|nr:YhcN/YlaJ family sporulation lipoprotein [Paenibacillus humicola]
MQRTLKLLAAGALIGTMLSGCMEKQGDLGNRNIREQGVRFDANGNRILNKRFADDQMNEMNRVDGRRLNSNNIVGSHANYRLEMSDEIADRIAAMKEVNRAYVMLTDNNAYVAVSLNEGTKGGKENDGKQPPLSRTNQAFQRPGILNPLNYGASLPGTYRIQSADVAGALKDKIAREVQRMAPQIKNVYVSANPDFMSRMTSYMEDVRLGHPIQGFVAEFNAMVERVFPARSGAAH